MATLDTGGFTDQRIARFALDVGRFFRLIPRIAIITFTVAYTEPMFFAFDHEPSGGILLTRLREDASPETVVPSDTLVSFSYEGGRVRIDELQGPVIGTRYRFTFAVIG